jgi:iron complex transport system ATP-binding protein
LIALVGPNGAGKSSLLSVASRLSAPSQGQVLLDGQELSRTASDQLARRMAILRQDTSMSARLTVGDLVAFGRFPYCRGRLGPQDRAQVTAALEAMELTALKESFLDEISGGQRQRAFIAMVLCQDTDYIFLDEPLNNLDMKHAAAMMAIFRRLVDQMGKTVVVVLHDINFASCYADRIIALRDGRVLYDGAPEDVITVPVLEDLYGLPTAVHQLDGQRIVTYYRPIP